MRAEAPDDAAARHAGAPVGPVADEQDLVVVPVEESPPQLAERRLVDDVGGALDLEAARRVVPIGLWGGPDAVRNSARQVVADPEAVAVGDAEEVLGRVGVVEDDLGGRVAAAGEVAGALGAGRRDEAGEDLARVVDGDGREEVPVRAVRRQVGDPHGAVLALGNVGRLVGRVVGVSLVPVRDSFHVAHELLLLSERPGGGLRVQLHVHRFEELSWAALKATDAGTETAGVTEALAASWNQLLILLLLLLLLT